MRRLAAHLAFVLTIGLVLATLAGCGGTATPAKTDATPPADSGAPAASDDAPVTYPPAPADVSGMQDWLAKAYPDVPWLGRIKKVEYVAGEVPDSGGFANAIVLTTDLDFASEQGVADEIGAAIGEAHPSWAKQFVLRYADGKNITAGDIVDRTP